MKGLGCLIQDTSIRKDIANIMEIAAADAIENDKQFSVGLAYKFIRENGIEIDKESVAFIYEDVFDLNDGNFSSQESVDEFAFREFEQTLDNLVAMTPETKVQQIGAQSPGKAAARQLATLFRNAMVTDSKTKTVMKQLQDIMFKAAQRKVNKEVLPQKQQENKSKSFEEILQDAFHWQDEIGIQRLTDGINGAREVFAEFNNEVKNYINRMIADGADQSDIDTFQQYADKLIDKSYNLLLSQKEAQDIIKTALVEKGFSKKIKKNGEELLVFDWEKLSDKTGIPNYIRDNVSEALKEKGFTEEQINRVNDSLIDEYNDLTAQVIEKSAEKIRQENERQSQRNLSELERRNKIQKYNQSIDAKKLARLYNLGLFDFSPMAYENLLNKMLGMSDIDAKTWNRLRVFGRALTTLYSAKFVNSAGEEVDLPEPMKKAALNSINEQIGTILRYHQNDNSLLLRVVRAIDGWISAGMRMVLANTGNMILDNPISGFFASKTADLKLLASGTLGGNEFSQHRKAFSRAVFNDIAYGRGEHYGDVSSTFYVRNALDHLKNKVDDALTGGEGKWSGFVQTVLTFYTGKMMLDGLDSRFKANLTNKYLIHNLIKILTDKNNPNGFKTKEQAFDFITKNMIGKGYEEAQKQSEDIVKAVNDAAGTKILNDSVDFVNRLANDIVLGNLIAYQPNLGRKVITDEQVMAAYNAAYKAAGRDLGHVPNNFVSVMITQLSGYFTRKTDQYVKDKRYTEAALTTFAQSLNKNLLNPFVGGATNWLVLTAERMGLGLVTGAFDIVKDKMDGKTGTTLRFGDDANMKKFENALYETQVSQAKIARGIVGGVSAIAVSAIAMQVIAAAIGADDDDDEAEVLRKYTEWREKNLYVSKFIDRLSPEIIMASMAYISGTLPQYASRKWSLGRDTFSPQEKVGYAINYLAKGDEGKASGKLGELIGGFVNAPVPWRLIKDDVQLVQGFKGEYEKPAYVTSESFWDGFLRGGFLEYTGLYDPMKQLYDIEVPAKLKIGQKEYQLSEDRQTELNNMAQAKFDQKIGEIENLPMYKEGDPDTKKKIVEQAVKEAIINAEYNFTLKYPKEYAGETVAEYNERIGKKREAQWIKDSSKYEIQKVIHEIKEQ